MNLRSWILIATVGILLGVGAIGWFYQDTAGGPLVIDVRVNNLGNQSVWVDTWIHSELEGDLSTIEDRDCAGTYRYDTEYYRESRQYAKLDSTTHLVPGNGSFEGNCTVELASGRILWVTVGTNSGGLTTVRNCQFYGSQLGFSFEGLQRAVIILDVFEDKTFQLKVNGDGKPLPWFHRVDYPPFSPEDHCGGLR